MNDEIFYNHDHDESQESIDQKYLKREILFEMDESDESKVPLRLSSDMSEADRTSPCDRDQSSDLQSVSMSDVSHPDKDFMKPRGRLSASPQLHPLQPWSEDLSDPHGSHPHLYTDNRMTAATSTKTIFPCNESDVMPRQENIHKGYNDSQFGSFEGQKYSIPQVEYLPCQSYSLPFLYETPCTESFKSYFDSNAKKSALKRSRFEDKSLTERLSPTNLYLSNCSIPSSSQSNQVKGELFEMMFVPGSSTPEAYQSLKVSITNVDMWRQFQSIGTEMIVTNVGRRMFPYLAIKIEGLQPEKHYSLHVDMVLYEPNTLKFQAGQWVPNGQSEVYPPPDREVPSVYNHPDSPNTGKFWMKRDISFNKLKITNDRRFKETSTSTPIFVYSMHKFLPRIHICEQLAEPSHPRSHKSSEQLKPYASIYFPGTEFIAVTAYQNSDVTELKIHHNPFAKGFRDRSTNFDEKYLLHLNEQESVPPPNKLSKKDPFQSFGTTSKSGDYLQYSPPPPGHEVNNFSMFSDLCISEFSLSKQLHSSYPHYNSSSLSSLPIYPPMTSYLPQSGYSYYYPYYSNHSSIEPTTHHSSRFYQPLTDQYPPTNSGPTLNLSDIHSTWTNSSPLHPQKSIHDHCEGATSELYESHYYYHPSTSSMMQYPHRPNFHSEDTHTDITKESSRSSPYCKKFISENPYSS